MCEYCEKSATIAALDAGNGVYNSVFIESGLLISHVQVCGNETVRDVEINYCPMCGKKLKVQEAEP